MKKLLCISLMIVCLKLHSQTYNPAEWKKANRTENVLTEMQLLGVGLAFIGLYDHNSDLIWIGYGWMCGIEMYRMDFRRRNKPLYLAFSPGRVSLCMSLNRK